MNTPNIRWNICSIALCRLFVCSCFKPGTKHLTKTWKHEVLPEGIFSSTKLFEPRHDKSNKMSVRPAKTQISLGIRPVWSESSMSARRKLGSLATHKAHSEDCDQTGRMPRLIWVFAGRTLIVLVLSCRGSFLYCTVRCSSSAPWSTKSLRCNGVRNQAGMQPSWLELFILTQRLE